MKVALPDYRGVPETINYNGGVAAEIGECNE